MNHGREFIVTEQHLKLLRHMYVGWQDCETGAPEIDPKRPYGNSDVPGDIHEILTGERNAELTREQEELYLALHRETDTVLQIVLRTGEAWPGRYVRPSEYDCDWRLAP